MFYSEKTVPDYMKYSINTVLSVDKDASIYFCTDEKVNFKNVKTLKLSEIASDITKNIRDSNLDHKSSIARIFYLNDVMRELNLKYFVHFDNDVLIYKPFSSLKNVFMENKLSITKPSNSKIIFGYSYINSSEVLSKLTKKIIETIEFGVSNTWSFNYDVPFKEEDLLITTKRIILTSLSHFCPTTIDSLTCLKFSITEYISAVPSLTPPGLSVASDRP